MKLHRFIGDYNLNEDEVEITNLENIKQIKGVLRLEVMSHLILCDGKGEEAEVEVLEMSKDKILTKIIKKIENKEIFNKVSLYLAILKKENFELAVQKATECGVSEIIPVITERTIKTGLNMERLNKIILEASEQSGRNTLPKLYEIINFKDAILDGNKNKEKLFFDLGQNENTKKQTDSNSASIFVGPEGGFTKEEQAHAIENDYRIESLGSLTLRAETAAIIATYKVVNNL